MMYSKGNNKEYSKAVVNEAWDMVTAEGKSLHSVATEILEAAMQKADQLVFCAEMSDSYKTTCAEKRWIAGKIRPAWEELQARREK